MSIPKNEGWSYADRLRQVSVASANHQANLEKERLEYFKAHRYAHLLDRASVVNSASLDTDPTILPGLPGAYPLMDAAEDHNSRAFGVWFPFWGQD